MCLSVAQLDKINICLTFFSRLYVMDLVFQYLFEAFFGSMRNIYVHTQSNCRKKNITQHIFVTNKTFVSCGYCEKYVRTRTKVNLTGSDLLWTTVSCFLFRKFYRKNELSSKCHAENSQRFGKVSNQKIENKFVCSFPFIFHALKDPQLEGQ